LLIVTVGEPGGEVPLLEIYAVCWVFKMNWQIFQKVVYKALYFDYLNKGGIAEVRDLKHLILIIPEWQDFQKLLRDIKQGA
jgi:hypothetical protein